jgi:hypothetical protein
MQTTSPLIVDPPQEQLLCPLCGYDLRRLTEPRCPECGYTFTWDELRDPDRRRHPYLFEHYPERNAWSFVRTLVGSLRPRKFWAALSPQGRSSPRRLVIYWLLTLAFIVPAYAALYAATALHMHMTSSARKALQLKFAATGAAQRRALQQFLDLNDPPFPSAHFLKRAAVQPLTQAFLPLLVACAAWPWMTALTMRLFLWLSLRRARLRFVHLMRCTLYSADAITWAWLICVIAGAMLSLQGLMGNTKPALVWGAASTNDSSMAMVPGIALGWLAALTVLYRLAIAIRKYLRLKHAVLIVVLTQFIVLIEVMCVIGLILSLFE